MYKSAIVTIFLLLSCFGWANNVKALAKKPLLISYVDHPTIKNQYLPLVIAMYEQAGIPIELTPVSNTQRTLVGINQGLYDADTGKVLQVITDYPAITYVPTPLSRGTLYLICRIEVECNEQIVFKLEAKIVAPFSKEIIQQVHPIRAQIHTVTSKGAAINMLEKKRTSYALIGDDSNVSPINGAHHFTVVSLTSTNIYHVINKKHQHLIPQLDEALQDLLQR